MMQLKPGYKLRQVLDMYVVMGTGKEAYRPNSIMSVNETGAFLWNLLAEGAEEAELVQKMLDSYEVDEATARSDVQRFIAQLKEKALIAEC